MADRWLIDRLMRLMSKRAVDKCVIVFGTRGFETLAPWPRQEVVKMRRVRPSVLA
jgi:hypothetical protein